MERMKIVKTQDLCTSIPIVRIIKTEVQKKDDGNWIVVAAVDHDRAVTLARYPTEDDALAAETQMWLCEGSIFIFPVIGGDV